MADLASWLLEQISKDEEIARAVQTGPWTAQVDGPEVVVRGAPDYEGDPYMRVADYEDVIHIATWDPARVLAECEAKRRLVELHNIPCDVCMTGEYVTIDPPSRHDVPATYGMDPCLTLRLLALPYADRPGFDETWRPDTEG